MSQLCSVLSKREDLVDFRPAVHNKLFSIDDTFDMRFSAFLSLKSALEKKKYECFGSLFKLVVGYLCTERHSDSVFSVFMKLRCTILSIGLSTADKDYLLDNAIRQCDSLETVQVISVDCCSSSSGFEMLVEIANTFIHKYIVFSTKYGNRYKQLADLASDFPLQVIEEIMSFTDDTTMTTSVVLKRCECIDSTALSDLIHLFAASRYSGAHCRLHIVLVTSTLCSLPVPDDITARSKMQVTSHVIGGPQQIYDDLMSFVYNFENIPIVFPKVLVESIHIAFQEFNLCITSTVNRLIFILNLHFQLKRSLLCVYKHLSLVSEMVKKKASDASDSLTKLLQFIGLKEVEGTDVRLSAAEQMERLKMFEERVKVDRTLFNLFKMLRDKVTRSKSITLAPSDLLWSAVSNGKLSHTGATSRVLHELIHDAVKYFLPFVPYRKVVELLNTVRDMFGAIDVTELHKYDDAGIALAAIAAAAASVGVAPLPAKKGSNGNSGSSSTADSTVPDASVKDFVESVKHDVASLLLILEKFKTDFLYGGFTGVSNKECTALSLSGMREKFVNDPSCMKSSKIDLRSSSHTIGKGKSGSTDADMVSVNCIDMYEGILADIISWLEGLVRALRRLSPVRPVDGVFHLTEQCIATLQECTDDNLQTTFTTALEYPHRFIGRKRSGSASRSALDCEIMYSKFKELRTGQVVANEWIHELVNNGDPWEDASKEISKDNKKKSKTDATENKAKPSNGDINGSSGDAVPEGPVHATMRCRFAATLHDMEKSGMLKCRRTGKNGLVVISREMFAWMSDT